MYIITVIPIKKGLPSEFLSYFSTEEIKPGTIVVIPIKSKEEDGIVINSEKVIDLKTDIKNREYQIKRVIKIKGESPFDEKFFEACQIAKKYFISNTGTIIKSLLPSIFVENLNQLKNKKSENNLEKRVGEKFIFQAEEQDRIAFYRTLIRESFAKKESVFLCAPTKYDIDLFNRELSKGIESFTFLFHSDFPKKKIIENYNSVIEKDHPVLIIGTGIFMSIPRNDIQTLIIERENSDSYKQISKPFLDIRTFAEIFSHTLKIKLIFGDSLLRPETLYRYDQGEFNEISSPSYRLNQADNIEIIDMKKEDENNKKFQIFSDNVLNSINKVFEKNQSIFLFTLRKGLAPMTICNDCKNVLLCPSCSTPVVLYESKQKDKADIKERIFMCNKCGKKERTNISCPFCNSWNLVPLGIGIDKVKEELESLYSESKIFQIDKESVKNEKEANVIIENFYKTPKSILLGTEMALFYLDKKVFYSAIISLDSLFSIPNFNIGQKIIHLIDKLKNITETTLTVQTRIIENKIIQSIISKNILSFLREDLQERKMFGYPPFKRLIKITFEGSSKETELARNSLGKILSSYDPQIFSAFVGKVRGNYITNTVIKVDIKNWPIIEKECKQIDSDLLNILYSLPTTFIINVDPEDLL